MEEEIWKPVPEYEDNYNVSDMGQVMNAKTGRILRFQKRTNGYLQLNLYKNGNPSMKYVHRIVAESFISNPENKPCIDHIDGNPMNNCVWNLRWCTQKENCNNPISIKRHSEAHNRPIKHIVCLKDNQIIKIYKVMNNIKKDGFYTSNVIACCRGKRKSHKGYNWMYLSDYEKRQG